MSDYQNAVQHLIDLGYSRDTANDIASMDVATDEQQAHYEYILSCDANGISDWIGIKAPTQVQELTEQEIEAAIVQINARVREPYRCESGDFPWLDATNFDSWVQALEQEGSIEIAGFYSRSGKPETVRRASINASAAWGCL